MMKRYLSLLAFACLSSTALAKLPPLSDAEKAKAQEAAARTQWSDKVAAYQLCESMNQVASRYLYSPQAQGKAVSPVSTPDCVHPGEFSYTPQAETKPIEAAGAHSPPQAATAPPSTQQPAAAVSNKP